jgi:hypothetical protein
MLSINLSIEKAEKFSSKSSFNQADLYYLNGLILEASSGLNIIYDFLNMNSDLYHNNPNIKQTTLLQNYYLTQNESYLGHSLLKKYNFAAQKERIEKLKREVSNEK